MADEPKRKVEVHFEYGRTPGYRNFHVDGIYGGLTPKGVLHMDFFVEKNPIPEKESYLIEGSKLNPSARDCSKAVLREVEGGLIMDYNMMKSMRAWLDTKIEEFERDHVAPRRPTQKH